MSEEGKQSHHHHHGHHHDHHHDHHHEESQPPPPPPPPPVVGEYGTFEAPPQPVVGFPKPVPPPGALEPSEYYARGYQSVPVDLKPLLPSKYKGKQSHHHHHGHHHDHHHDHHHEESQPPPPPPPPVVGEYGTFEAPPQPVVGFPKPVPPPGALEPSEYYARGYQSVPGYVVDERRPVREPRLPCCGIGFGWFLFIIGFFLAAFPWYVAAFILLCTRSVDHREKPGYVSCTIAAVLAAIALIFGLTRI